MIIQIKIKPELIEWVSDQTGMDRDEAHEFTKQFAGMLYFTGAFEGIEPRPEPVLNVVEGFIEGLGPKSADVNTELATLAIEALEPYARRFMAQYERKGSSWQKEWFLSWQQANLILKAFDSEPMGADVKPEQPVELPLTLG